MRRVEVGAKLCLRTLASAVSYKFSFIFGQYLLAGKKEFPSDIFHIRTTLLAASFMCIIML